MMYINVEIGTKGKKVSGGQNWHVMCNPVNMSNKAFERLTS